ncbi:hypothetical protein MF672_038900 [Actinomadura sp. ATCC 31491]|uniref:Uncharacterized protein n=1 Tax=Actinomadura luzonensis TaxID=2805427 RepID=A0ABT0G5S1_9ACTN|nr:hypothetical protein [Actinomadura luzonensis]MCK2219723.1 hypothetical protein [Actinomadura luzonensis]
MTALWIALAAIIYAAGFTATARAVNLLDRRWPQLRMGEGEDVMLAIMWPLVAIAVVPLALLYRFATRDLKGDR